MSHTSELRAVFSLFFMKGKSVVGRHALGPAMQGGETCIVVLNKNPDACFVGPIHSYGCIIHNIMLCVCGWAVEGG